MLCKPLFHLRNRPFPFKRAGVAAVVLRPSGADVGDEFFPATPRMPFHITALKSIEQQLRLIQPRGVRRQQPGTPTALVRGQVRWGAASGMRAVPVVDQVSSPQMAVPPPKTPQGLGVVDRALVGKAYRFHPAAVDDQEDHDGNRAVPFILEFALFEWHPGWRGGSVPAPVPGSSATRRYRLPNSPVGPSGPHTFSPDGRYLLRSGSDFSIQVVDAQSGEPVGILGRHRDDIWCLRFSPDGKLLASASNDRTVKLWDATHLRQEQKPLLKIDLPFMPGMADRVAFSPDSRRLVTGGEKYTVKIWDARTGEAIQTLRGHTRDVRCVAVGPDGRWIASAGEDTTVRLWDAKTGKPVHKLRGHTSIVSSLSFSPDSRRLVSGSWDKTVRVWDLTRLGNRASLRPNAPGRSREDPASRYPPAVLTPGPPGGVQPRR